MGLTNSSTGMAAADSGLHFTRAASDRVVAFMGNPNVGKSTLFNALTGMNQHTGNWPGKTVAGAYGRHQSHGHDYILVDLPGTYSLNAHSAEEQVARDFLCFSHPDAAVVVCDATCLERNLNLVLQTLCIIKKVVVCVNLMDEAKKRGIQIDLDGLSKQLGVPVVGTSARKKQGLDEVVRQIENVYQSAPTKTAAATLPEPIDRATGLLIPYLTDTEINPKFAALRLLENDKDFLFAIDQHTQRPLSANHELKQVLTNIKTDLLANGFPSDIIRDDVLSASVRLAETISKSCVQYSKKKSYRQTLDRLLTGKWTGIPIMLLLLGGIFWITIAGANIPSQYLSTALFWVQDQLSAFFTWIGAPDWLKGVLVDGMYRTLAWVVSVMLPPMAIFFPIFTLLEDFGYLPRVAFHLDHSFQKAGACGKQALTTCMGFGCNAAGVVGCRIIDSPRERLIAMITNNFVPCNGRFPTLIAIISMFFAGYLASPFSQSLASAAMLLGVIILGVCMTFWVSRILSHTILKGIPSSFTLELPPYRRPQICQVIVRSLLDRTLFVLGRAAMVAAPAGIILWLAANITIGDLSILTHIANFLDPFAALFGLDGFILIAFILGFPANEIVFPIILMGYLSQGSLMGFDNLSQMHLLLTQSGWTWLTAVCTILFCLMHWPCSTTCLTIRKESASWKWTAVAFAVPTITGLTCCFIVTTVARLFGIA